MPAARFLVWLDHGGAIVSDGMLMCLENGPLLRRV